MDAIKVMQERGFTYFTLNRHEGYWQAAAYMPSGRPTIDYRDARGPTPAEAFEALLTAEDVSMPNPHYRGDVEVPA